jgi:phage FluMu protein Com
MKKANEVKCVRCNKALSEAQLKYIKLEGYVLGYYIPICSKCRDKEYIKEYDLSCLKLSERG